MQLWVKAQVSPSLGGCQARKRIRKPGGAPKLSSRRRSYAAWTASSHLHWARQTKLWHTHSGPIQASNSKSARRPSSAPAWAALAPSQKQCARRMAKGRSACRLSPYQLSWPIWRPDKCRSGTCSRVLWVLRWTACAASIQAIGDAARLIRNDEADMALCGGSEATIDRVALGSFAAAKAVTTYCEGDPAKASRPFDLARDGFVMAEGAGLLVLEALDHALARGGQAAGRGRGLRHLC